MASQGGHPRLTRRNITQNTPAAAATDNAKDKEYEPVSAITPPHALPELSVHSKNIAFFDSFSNCAVYHTNIVLFSRMVIYPHLWYTI